MKGRPFRGARGLRRLFALIYTGALILAAVIGWQRPRLETLIREGLDEPSDRALRVMRSAQRRGELGELDLSELYAAYLRASEPERFDRLPSLAFDAAPEAMGRQVRRTLVAGSHAQRVRAADFARRACHPEARAALEWGMSWNRRVRGVDSGPEPGLEYRGCPTEGARDDERQSR